MSEPLRARLLCCGAGALIGLGVGFVFFVITQPPRGPFPLFLPIVFAAVFAAVAFIAAEQLFPILLEIVAGFLSLVEAPISGIILRDDHAWISHFPGEGVRV